MFTVPLWLHGGVQTVGEKVEVEVEEGGQGGDYGIDMEVEWGEVDGLGFYLKFETMGFTDRKWV